MKYNRKMVRPLKTSISLFIKNGAHLCALAFFALSCESAKNFSQKNASLNSEAETEGGTIQSEDFIKNDENSKAENFFEENPNWEILLPEKTELIQSGKTKITFRANVQKAALYINNIFSGLSPLEINGLVPGDYYVMMKKRGLKTAYGAISVRDGVSDFYYVEMRKEEKIQAEEDAALEEKIKAEKN